MIAATVNGVIALKNERDATRVMKLPVALAFFSIVAFVHAQKKYSRPNRAAPRRNRSRQGAVIHRDVGQCFFQFMRLKYPTIFWLICAPLVLWAQPRVLVNSIPTAASFAGVTPLRLPFADAQTQDPKEIEAGLNQAIAGLLPSLEQQGYSYICLLSAAGDQPIEVPIAAAKAKLALSRKGTAIEVLFYRGGHEAANPASYLVGTPPSKTAHLSLSIKKISVPAGGSTAGWVYYNLTRVQADAEKAKSQTIFISASGSGPVVAVPIPGMKDALMVPDEKSTLDLSWDLPPGTKASDKLEVMGHSIDDEKNKTGARP
ncbi:MAG: hypothetical protein ABI273_11380 [Lacunisphaera sp.]